MYSIGVDVGGTKICTGIMDETGTLIQSLEVPTLAVEGPEAVIRRIKDTILAMFQHVSREYILGIGIGAPGPLNPHTGTIQDPPNLPGWDGIRLPEMIQNDVSLPVYLDNDANAAAVAEHRYGAGAGAKNMVYVTVSTGIGAGVVVDGRVRQGATGSFGEIGHTIIQPDGPLCTCGNRGCLEALASGTAIQRKAREVFGCDMTAKEVAELAATGEARAQSILDVTFRYLGIGLVNLVNLFDPEVMVIGGGLSQIGEPMFRALREALSANRFHPTPTNTRLCAAQLGTKAGVIGAASLPFVHHSQR